MTAVGQEGRRERDIDKTRREGQGLAMGRKECVVFVYEKAERQCVVERWRRVFRKVFFWLVEWQSHSHLHTPH